MSLIAAAVLASIVLDAGSGRVLSQSGAVDRAATPGSVLKPFTALALLESRGFDPHALFPCRRQVRIAGRRLDCSHPALAQPLDLAGAIAYSCNSYFTEMARRLDPVRFAAVLQRFGLSMPVPGDPEQLALAAIGESVIEVSPRQLALAYLRLAREHRADALSAGLEAATEFGTGQLARPTGTRVAGKTGTSARHAWFAGWAPAKHPRVIVVVFTPNGRGGSDAAPAARRLFERHLKR